VVDVDALGRDAKLGQGVALGGEILLVGGDARVADQQARTAESAPANASGTT
jgi:hypothetical protein